MKKREYVASYERDETGAWIVEIASVRGCHSWGRSIERARSNIREALALFVGDGAAEAAQIRDEILAPDAVRELVSRVRRARDVAEKASIDAAEATREAVGVLTRDQHMTIRDAAEVIGVSFQRVHQIAGETARHGASIATEAPARHGRRCRKRAR